MGGGVGQGMGEQLAAQVGEGEVCLAGEGVVGEADDLLFPGFVAHLGAAQHEDDLGSEALEEGDQFQGWAGVPDVDAEADDARVPGQQGLRDFERRLLDFELHDLGAGAQVAQVGEQASEPEGRVDELRVEGGEDDVGHASCGFLTVGKSRAPVRGVDIARVSPGWPPGRGVAAVTSRDRVSIRCPDPCPRVGRRCSRHGSG